MRSRVAILHQGFIPEYRVAFFELLNRRSEREYVVFHGDPPTGTGARRAAGPFRFPNVEVRSLELRVSGRPIVYQPVLRRVLRGRFDGVVLGPVMKLVSIPMLFAAFKMLRRPVILWGHGFVPEEELRGFAPVMSVAATRVKQRLATLADGYMAYTQGGARRLADSGVPADRISVLRNALDTAEQDALHHRLRDVDPAVLRRQLGLEADSRVLLFVGRVYREKRLGELIDAISIVRDRALANARIEVVVIGDGPDLVPARGRARALRGFHFLGEIYDQEVVARYLRVAHALVIPGKVGLAVNHAFAHGVPVVTRESDLHAPEVEYIEHATNGILVSGGLERFAEAIADLVDDDRRRDVLAAGALRTASELTLDAMVDVFDRAVGRALAARRRAS